MSSILCILLVFGSVQARPDYPLKDGKPTSKGIDSYVEENAEDLITEFQAFIDDTLYNTNIYTDDLSENMEHNPLELGNYYPNEIFITNAEVFHAYELNDLSGYSRDTLGNSNLFVKAAVFHELGHHYTYQLGIEMLRIDQVGMDRAYQSFFRIYSIREAPGRKFIEEGICEYINLNMKQILAPRRPRTPRHLSDLTDPKKQYQIFYQYAPYYLRDFLDTHGLKRGIKILLHNPPPSPEEILEPDRFFARLRYFD